jgi:hypothetical protein
MAPASFLQRFIDYLATRSQRRRIRRHFRETTGYEGNFENPRSHQEKVQFRKLYGNHAFYASVADKYGVREYVAKRIGTEHLIPLLGVHESLRADMFDDLPQRFIIKATHGCKWNQVVLDKSRLDIDATVRHFNRLLKKRYGYGGGERHYNFIKPRVVIEALLQDRDGGLPWDYGFFCYNGPGGFDYSFGIGSPKGKAATFTKDWEMLSSTLTEEELAPHLKPANFEAMVEIAKTLSAEFDFVRVDLYSVEGRIYFGELTCTPHRGYGAIEPPKRQQMRDAMWQLDALNPRLYRAPKSYRG